jgi:hypothetical protein
MADLSGQRSSRSNGRPFSVHRIPVRGRIRGHCGKTVIKRGGIKVAKFLAGFTIVVLVLALVVGFSLLLAWPTLWLVNYLFTSQVLLTLFGIPALTFWKAFWLNFFFGAAFKSTYTTSK